MLGLPVRDQRRVRTQRAGALRRLDVGPRTDPIDQALALEGIRALRAGLPRVVADPMELAGREQTLYGAYLSAVAFASAGSGLHHKICHVLGGMFDLPHAETHAVVLPYVLALNAPAVPDLDAADGRGVRRRLGTGRTARAARRDRRAPRACATSAWTRTTSPRAVRPILDAVAAEQPDAGHGREHRGAAARGWEGRSPG